MSQRELRWTVVIVDLDPVIGHEQGRERRALVVSYEPLHRAGMIAVCPVTAARPEARYPGDVAIKAGEAGQTLPGVILCHQLRTISVLRVRGIAGRLTNPDLRRQVRTYLARHLGLHTPSRDDGADGAEAYASHS